MSNPSEENYISEAYAAAQKDDIEKFKSIVPSKVPFNQSV